MKVEAELEDSQIVEERRVADIFAKQQEKNAKWSWS
jgi:hypothetical protein